MPKMTPEIKAKLARWHNMTPEFIADELGSTRDKIKDLKQDEELLKTVLESKVPNIPEFNIHTDAIAGESHILSYTIFKTSRFSQEKAKEFLTEEQWNQCFNVSEVKQVRTTARKKQDEETNS